MSRRLEPGAIAAVFVRGVWHPGIMLGSIGPDGEPEVIHCSQRVGHVEVEPWPDFAPSGRIVWRAPPSRLPPREVTARATSRLGRPWHVGRYNCEHFVCDAYGVPLVSTQARAALAVGAVAALRIFGGWA